MLQPKLDSTKALLLVTSIKTVRTTKLAFVERCVFGLGFFGVGLWWFGLEVPGNPQPLRCVTFVKQSL